MAQQDRKSGGIDHIEGPTVPRDNITLLYISDMQFGRNHPFGRLGLPGADADFDTLLRRLTDDLASLRDGEHQLPPDLLVVSGDLAEWGKKSEFDDASVFLTRMMGSVVPAPPSTKLAPYLPPGTLRRLELDEPFGETPQ